MGKFDKLSELFGRHSLDERPSRSHRRSSNASQHEGRGRRHSREDNRDSDRRSRRGQAPSISPGRVAYERTRYEANTYRQRSPIRPSRTSSHRTGESEYKMSRRPSRSHRETRGDSIFDNRKTHRRRDDSTRRSRSPSRRHRDNRTDKELSERLEGLSFREPRRYISKIDRIYELN